MKPMEEKARELAKNILLFCITDEAFEHEVETIRLALVAARNDGVSAAAQGVPTNWADSALTGPDGIGAPPYDCRQLEKLLRTTQDRIRAMKEE